MPSLRSLVLLLCGALTAVAADSPRKIAYEQDAKIFVANLDGTGAKKVAKGVSPDIAPDATRVAFNTEEEAGKTFARHIAVVDVASGSTTVFNKDLPSDNAFGPKWSPDGKQILFSIFDGKNWNLGLINADGTGFRYAYKAKSDSDMMSAPAWAADGKSFFAQDMKNIYRLNLDGSEIAHWEIAKCIANGDMSSSGRIDVSPDGRTLLLGIDMNEEAHRKSWDGPLPAVWTLDLESKKGTRITSKKLFGWDGCWIDGSTILFLTQAATEKSPSLATMPLSGSPSKAIVKGVRDPSVSH